MMFLELSLILITILLTTGMILIYLRIEELERKRKPLFDARCHIIGCEENVIIDHNSGKRWKINYTQERDFKIASSYFDLTQITFEVDEVTKYWDVVDSRFVLYYNTVMLTVNKSNIFFKINKFEYNPIKNILILGINNKELNLILIGDHWVDFITNDIFFDANSKDPEVLLEISTYF